MRPRAFVAALVIVASCAEGTPATDDATSTPTTPTITVLSTTSTTPATTTTDASTTTTTPATTTTAASPSTTVAPTTTLPLAEPDGRVPVIVDTDANNELDDQHAIAYVLLSDDVFDVIGLTINRTSNGGALDRHVAEAERVATLVGRDVPIVAGANGGFADIVSQMDEADFDGRPAVDFIIDSVRGRAGETVLLLPIGKLTNIALAVLKAPDIADSVRIVWLGSNYPFPGEYNQDNDEAALQFLLDADVPFEIALVRAGDDTGTAAVLVTLGEIRVRMAGLGPTADPAVAGRDGGAFTSFGDYSIDLFDRALRGDELAPRALYDLAAAAIIREPTWATPIVIPAPALVDGAWVERPENERTITIWERFDRDAIVDSLVTVLAGVGAG